VEYLLENLIRYFPKGGKPRVLFVGLRYDYGDITRGLSYEENNFLNSLLNMGYDLIAYDLFASKAKYGKKIANNILKEISFRFKPDIIFFILFKDELDINALLEIRHILKIKTINWFCDDHWRFNIFSKYYAPYFDYVVTTFPEAVEKYKQIGCKNIIVSQWGFNHFLYRKLDLDYKYDVSFVGQPHGDRIKVINALKKAGINVATFGLGWPNGRVSTYEMVKIFNQTKINLNLSNASRGRINQVKGRDFEIPGSGGFMITGESEDLKQYFLPGKEIETYKNLTELVEKVRYYLKHDTEREAIKESGYIKAQREHTYELRLNKIFDIIFKEP
jgi:spore maturation protein CgeB